ncbi:MAG: hypothetical protein H7338_17035 [Candidatus Sericytochromatia bacterium]|nr:hypothetical protein [Candidatus Sericytochromatia bacterium]
MILNATSSAVGAIHNDTTGRDPWISRPLFPNAPATALFSPARSALQGLADQLQRYQTDTEHRSASGQVHQAGPAWDNYVETAQIRHQTLCRLVTETNAALGRTLSFKAIAAFDDRVSQGQEPTAMLLMALNWAEDLDQQVYDQFLNWLRDVRPEPATLQSLIDGTHQWQYRSHLPDGDDGKPMEASHNVPPAVTAPAQSLAMTL